MQEQPVFCLCEECGKEIYFGEECKFDKQSKFYVHEECLEDYINNFITNRIAGDENEL